MNISECVQFYDDCELYEYANELLHAPAKEIFDEKHSPHSIWFNALPQHFATTHPFEPHQFVLCQPTLQHFVSLQALPQHLVLLAAPSSAQPAASYSPERSVEQDEQPPIIRCPCGCNEMCTPAEIVEHESQARAAEDREFAIISRALESMRFTMNLPQCDFLRQLRLVCTKPEALAQEVEAPTDGDVAFITETLESMRITMNLPVYHFTNQLRKAACRYEHQDRCEEHAMPDTSQQF